MAEKSLDGSTRYSTQHDASSEGFPLYYESQRNNHVFAPDTPQALSIFKKALPRDPPVCLPFGFV